MVALAGTKSARAPVLAKYEVLEELGHGGMATVYRAHDKRLGRDVAIKVLHPHLRENAEIAHRFEVEAQAVAKLRHPNIVEVFDVSSAEDTEQYLVVELVRGPTLRKILQERGAMPPEIAAAIVLELLAGIVNAHAQGVVHRDVKPENVLVEHRIRSESAATSSGYPPPLTIPPTSRHTAAASGSGQRVAVKLTDFGIAKLLDAQGVTSTGQVLGSPAHMAPEQIEGGDVDGRADVFGLGVLLYECMVGHLPFLGNNPAQVLRRVLDGMYTPAERERPVVGKNWSQILDRALARNPDDRYPDAGAMRDAVTAELDRLDVGAPRNAIEAWLDDPEAWTDAHGARLIVKLCELGAGSRKLGQAVAAAADYNRALAYAPNDPSLLRIVTTMHRSEQRLRLLRRVVPLVLGGVILGFGGYSVARALKPRPIAGRPISEEAPVERTPITEESVPPPMIATAPVVSVAPVVTVHTIATPTVAPKPVQRTVTISSLRPAFGVHLTIDGVAAADPDPHNPFTIDDKAHTLLFSCTSDLCAPKTVTLAAGDKNETMPIELAIAAARLIIDGDPGHTYGIEEMPRVTITSGQETELPMVAGSRPVTIFDWVDPSKRQSTVVQAGKRATVSFRAK